MATAGWGAHGKETRQRNIGDRTAARSGGHLSVPRLLLTFLLAFVSTFSYGAMALTGGAYAPVNTAAPGHAPVTSGSPGVTSSEVPLLNAPERVSHIPTPVAPGVPVPAPTVLTPPARSSVLGPSMPSIVPPAHPGVSPVTTPVSSPTATHGAPVVPSPAPKESTGASVTPATDPTPSPSFKVDGVVGGDAAIAGSTFTLPGLTTSQANDLIVVVADSDDATAGSPCPASGVTSASPSLSFTERISATDPANHQLSVTEWYSVASTSVSGMAITITYPTTSPACQTVPTIVMGLAFGVADVDLAHPFDSAPNTGGGEQQLPGTPSAGAVATTYANDMMLGLLSIDLLSSPCCYTPPGPGPSYSIIGTAEFTGSAGQTAEAEGNVTHSPGTYSVNYGSTDFNSYAMIDDAVVEALTADAVTPNVITYDQGQSATLTSRASGGKAPYSITWYYAPSGSGTCNPVFANIGSGPTYSLPVYLTAGTYYFCYIVTDSESPAVSADSAISQVNINPVLGTPTRPTVTATHLDRNQVLTVRGVIPSGGTPSYSWQWQVSINGSSYSNTTFCINNGGSGATSGMSVTCDVFPNTFSPNTTYSFQLVVTDSSSSPSTTTSPPSAMVTVRSALVSFRPVISATRIDQDQLSGVGDEVTTGTSPYAFQWLVSVNSGAFTAVPSCSPNATSGTVNAYVVLLCMFQKGTLTVGKTYAFEFHISDSANVSETLTSPPTPTMTVHAPLSPGAISPIDPAIDNGMSVHLVSNVSGGFVPYAYQWLGGPSANCAADSVITGATSAIFSPSPTTSTYYCYVASDSANTSEIVVSATDLVTVYPALTTPTILASRTLLDIGQTVILTAGVSGGSGVYHYTWSGLPTGCSTADTDQLVCTPGGSGSSNIVVTVSDGEMSLSSTPLSVTVFIDPTISQPVASRATLDVGQLTSLLVSSTVGLGLTATYTWNGMPSGTGCASVNANSLSCYPSAAGTYTISVTYEDQNGYSVTSVPTTIIVSPALGPLALTSSLPVARPYLDVGQSVTLTASLSGGTGVYSYVWTNLPTGCATGDTAQLTCIPLGSGTFPVKVYANDTNGESSSNIYSMVVSRDPTVSTPLLSRPVLDAGQTVTISTTFSSGSGGGPGFVWIGLPNGCYTTNAASLLCSPSVAGTFAVSVSLTDSNGFTAVSGPISIVVDPALKSPVVSSDRYGVDVGQSFTLTATASGGSGSYTYYWGTLPVGCASLSVSTLSCTPLSVGAGSYIVTVTVNDTNGASVSNVLPSTLQVSPALFVSALSGSRSSMDVGQTTVLSASVSGGVAPYTFLWTGLPLGCTSLNTPTLSCTPTTPGSYSPSVSVTDANGFTTSSQSQGVVNAIPTGAEPQFLSYDPVNGFLYVPDTGSGQVSVINTTAWTTVATIAVGNGPTNAFYDPLNHLVYVTNVYSNNVSIINVTTETVVSTLNVSAGPNDVALDPTTGRLFIVDWYSSNFTVIDGGNNAIVGNFSLGANVEPGTITFDSANGEFYVTDYLTNNVTVIDASTLALVKNVTVGSGPYGIEYDPGNGMIYVSNDATSFVSVIDGANNTVISTLSVGPTPSGIAYDAQNGQLYVAACPGLSLVDGSTNTVTSTLAVGICLTGAISVAATGLTYVTDFNGSDLLAIQGPLPSLTLTVSATPSVGTPVASRLAGDVGQGVVFQTTASSGSGGYAFAWTLPAGLGCGAPATTGATSSVSCTLATAGTYTLSATVTDSNGDSVTSAALGFTVSSRPTVSPPGASVQAADVGETVTFSTTGTLGASPLVFAWSGLPSGCSGLSSAVVVCTFITPGSFTPTVTLTDANGVVVSAGMATAFTVSADPTIGTPMATPPTLDVGQSTTLVTSATNGTGLASSYVWYGLPTGCSSTNNLTLSCAPARAGTYSVSVSITDSNGMTRYSPTFSLVVSPVLGAVLVFVSRTTLDVGQSLTIAANAAGGTGVYTLSWTGLPAGCFNGGSVTIQCWPTTAATASISVIVTDSNGASVTLATPISVTVSADPTVGIPGAAPSTLDLGQTTTLSVAATNGTGAATITWWGLPAGCSSMDALSVTCAPSTSGSFEVTVSESDSNGVTVVSGPMTLVVSPSLGLPTLSWSTSSLDVGQALTLTVNESGGSSPWAYAWSGLPTGCVGNAATLTCIPMSAGSWTAKVTVTDGNGISQTSTGVTLTVAPRLTPGSIEVAPAILDVGQSTNLTAGVAGGSGGLSFVWFGLPAGCSSADLATIACRPSLPGTSWVTAWVTDRNGESVSVGPLALVVSPGLGTPLVSVSATSFELGGSVTFTASVSGGTAPLTYIWTGLPQGCAPIDAPTMTCTPTTTGTFSVSLDVRDATGTAASSTPVSVTVKAVPPQSFASGANGLEWALLALVVVLLALAILGIAYVLLRRNRGGAGTVRSSNGGSTPSPPTPEANPAAPSAPMEPTPAPSTAPDWKEDDPTDEEPGNP